MRRSMLLPIAMMLLAVSSLAAQTKPAGGGSVLNTTWKCAAPNPVNMIPVTDMTGHAYGVEQVACTATKGEVGLVPAAPSLPRIAGVMSALARRAWPYRRHNCCR